MSKPRPNRSRPLAAGDSVLVRSNWTDEWIEGTVRVVMSEQFSWTDKDGNWFYTKYNGEWKHANR